MSVTRFDLARRIVERFRRRGAPRRVAEVLRRQRRLSIRRVFNVSIGVHVHRGDRSTHVHTFEQRVVRVAATMPIVFRRQTPPPSFPGAMRVIEHEVLQRVLAREVRRETLMRDRRSTIVREGLDNPSSVVPRIPDPVAAVEFVLRRIAPVVEKVERGRSITDVRPQVFARAQAPAGDGRQATAPTIPLSPTELARLTDDVVRAIDRRFVAHRERRGVV
jgi:hypothetical protein